VVNRDVVHGLSPRSEGNSPFVHTESGHQNWSDLPTDIPEDPNSDTSRWASKSVPTDPHSPRLAEAIPFLLKSAAPTTGFLNNGSKRPFRSPQSLWVSSFGGKDTTLCPHSLSILFRSLQISERSWLNSLA
jgi:hypothetical protein